MPAHRLVTDAIHAHGALAGIELVHNGFHAGNKFSRLTPLAPTAMPVVSYDPIYAKAMDKFDLAEFRRWHREAALRAREGRVRYRLRLRRAQYDRLDAFSVAKIQSQDRRVWR